MKYSDHKSIATITILHFNGCFPVNWHHSISLLPPIVQKLRETFKEKWHKFLWAESPSCHQMNSIKALKETQNTEPNQRK